MGLSSLKKGTRGQWTQRDPGLCMMTARISNIEVMVFMICFFQLQSLHVPEAIRHVPTSFHL